MDAPIAARICSKIETVPGSMYAYAGSTYTNNRTRLNAIGLLALEILINPHYMGPSSPCRYWSRINLNQVMNFGQCLVLFVRIYDKGIRRNLRNRAASIPDGICKVRKKVRVFPCNAGKYQPEVIYRRYPIIKMLAAVVW